MPSVEPPALSWLHTCGPLPFQILVNAVRLTGAECSSKRTHESEKVVNYVKFIRDPVKSIRSNFLPLNSSVIFLPLNSSGTLSGHAGHELYFGKKHIKLTRGSFETPRVHAVQKLSGPVPEVNYVKFIRDPVKSIRSNFYL